MNIVEGWERSILSDQLELIRNGYSGKQIGQVTNFPVSRIETISNGIIDQSKVGYVNFIPDSYLLKPGDILFSNINSLKHIGKVAQVSDEIRLFHGMNLLVLRPVKQVDNKFLFYKLVNSKTWFEKMAAQAINQASINQETLRNLQLELPKEKREQTKIAEVISTIYRVIEQTEALIAKQQRIKTGLMQDLLTRGIDEHGNLRSEETHKFKDSPLGRIPVEWEIKPAFELCDSVIDCKNRTPPPASEGHPVIRTPNVRNGEFVYCDLNYTDSISYEIWIARGRPRAGDVVITREAPFGEACLIPNDLYEPCLGQRMMMYQPNLTKLRPDYLVFAIYSEALQEKLLELAGGSTVGHIRVGDIRKLPIPHPISIEEQKTISELLTIAAESIKKLELQGQKLLSLKTAIMQDLLTGKKRVIALLTDTGKVNL